MFCEFNKLIQLLQCFFVIFLSRFFSWRRRRRRRNLKKKTKKSREGWVVTVMVGKRRSPWKLDMERERERERERGYSDVMKSR